MIHTVPIVAQVAAQVAVQVAAQVAAQVMVRLVKNRQINDSPLLYGKKL